MSEGFSFQNWLLVTSPWISSSSFEERAGPGFSRQDFVEHPSDSRSAKSVAFIPAFSTRRQLGDTRSESQRTRRGHRKRPKPAQGANSAARAHRQAIVSPDRTRGQERRLVTLELKLSCPSRLEHAVERISLTCSFRSTHGRSGMQRGQHEDERGRHRARAEPQRGKAAAPVEERHRHRLEARRQKQQRHSIAACSATRTPRAVSRD